MTDKDEGSRTKAVRKAWDEVADRFAEVGRQFSEHYRKLGNESSATATEQGRAVNDAVKQAVAELDRALTSVGDALRDDETKEGLKRAARSLGDAMNSTFTELGDELRKRARR
jgi:gas vesicle protein